MIKEILDTLKPEEYRQLMHAFEHQFEQHIEFKPGKFVGVNIRTQRNFSIKKTIGAWSIGDIKR